MTLKSIIVVMCFALLTPFLTHAQHLKKTEDLFLSKTHIVNTDTLQYRMLLPKDFSKNKTYPVVLFLHGAGERGNDNKKQLANGSDLFLKESIRKTFPAIVIFPQCPENDYWAKLEADRSTKPITFTYKYKESPTKAMALVIDLMNDLVKKTYVKTNQVYVMGLSMGGMGTFEILYRKPNLFAAAIPICGGGNPESVKAYAKSTPLWVFHGAKDDVVDPNLSVNMVSALLKNGGVPRFTLYDYANHNSWDAAFAEPELLIWLFSKSNKI
ncbi:prolyl oligopeptidase family serine peptidase [Formosa sediminum]|uniref:Prolyl oligopeptidase family serine peptidase n=1 Tax=Formosa sediminum TaxID=2594004 RepID=A0A516GMH1_9FLAO|nr:prolyl oligopeptidase family serine peptidase [Formosa sediminum]QDO92580.1 prolyl oligopeptidase family serine peptidase [Formosa sediminum]